MFNYFFFMYNKTTITHTYIQFLLLTQNQIQITINNIHTYLHTNIDENKQRTKNQPTKTNQYFQIYSSKTGYRVVPSNIKLK